MLGVAKPSRTTISIVLSPVGPYFPTGLKPVTLFVDELRARAWPGGVGDVKAGGNYAPTILPMASAPGCSAQGSTCGIPPGWMMFV